MATLPEITALLGEPRFNWSDPAPWIELERELGIEFPADFREIVDAYGSIEINRQLYLTHPAGHLLHSLGVVRTREQVGPVRAIFVGRPAWSGAVHRKAEDRSS
ncbi:hypothetical protein ACGFYQ_41320 [Streptomyces sp. NPDC048258]|uniref:hypothetical protein n=1 Tax=Streptomyces sp. NPDC048258 TaxID=3365527 RepID=UPI00371AA2E8